MPYISETEHQNTMGVMLKLKTENVRLREALADMAKQPTLGELSDRGEDNEGDFESAYDEFIFRARAVIKNVT